MNVAFDTLEAARGLENAGFARDQAEAIAHVVKSGQGDLATKEHLNATKSELKAELKADIGEVKAELSELRADINEVKAELKGVDGRLNSRIDGLAGEVRSLRWFTGIATSLILAVTLTMLAIILNNAS